MHELQIDEANSAGRMILSGTLKIQEIIPLKEAFQEALKKVNTLKINHEGGKSFDLTYLQLLVALHKTASARGKTVSVEEKHPIEFISLVRGSGCPSYQWLNIDNDEDSARGGENG